MSVTLNGSTSGASLRELRENAKQIAATFFGTDCVSVHIDEADAETMEVRSAGGEALVGAAGFSATFQAQEHHVVDVPTYGFPKCRKCQKTESTLRKLPVAEWVS